MSSPEFNRFNVKQFFRYLILEPVTAKITLSSFYNLRNLMNLTIILLIISIAFKQILFSLILLFLYLIFDLIHIWRSGIFLNWTRDYQYKKLNTERKKTNEFKKQKSIPESEKEKIEIEVETEKEKVVTP